MSDIIQNAVRTPDGTILRSLHRHDFKCYTDSITGREYMVDGGVDYLRRGGDPDMVDLSVFITDPHEAVRQVDSLVQVGVPLKDTKERNILTILKLTNHLPSQIRKALENELKYRENSNDLC